MPVQPRWAIFAPHDRCTHAKASLADGFITEGCIECPIHMGLFDVRTGRAVSAPCTIDLKVYPVRQVGGGVKRLPGCAQTAWFACNFPGRVASERWAEGTVRVQCLS